MHYAGKLFTKPLFPKTLTEESSAKPKHRRSKKEQFLNDVCRVCEMSLLVECVLMEMEMELVYPRNTFRVGQELLGRYSRGSLLPQHAPVTRSHSKAPLSAPTISSENICCATKLLLPNFAPSYQTGLI